VNALFGMVDHCTVEVMAMRWLKRNLWKAGIMIAGTLLLLVLMAWIPVSATGEHEETSEVATKGSITVQATPTEDATVTTLSKAQLTQAVAGQQHTWDNWLWGNAATILSSFLSTLVIIIGVLIGFRQWSVSRKAKSRRIDARHKTKS
jgi:Na+-transporting NADH:ubiquinone oxidoreductase subunit NqrB